MSCSGRERNFTLLPQRSGLYHSKRRIVVVLAQPRLNPPVRTIHASRGKVLRTEHVVASNSTSSAAPGPGCEEPDRLGGLVYALTDLAERDTASALVWSEAVACRRRPKEQSGGHNPDVDSAQGCGRNKAERATIKEVPWT